MSERPLTERYRGYMLTVHPYSNGRGWFYEWRDGLNHMTDVEASNARGRECVMADARRFIDSRYLEEAADVERGLARMG